MTESKIEEAKRLAGIKAVADHFDPSFSYVGIGSGTTIIYVVEALKDVLSRTPSHTSSNPTTKPAIQFIPTGYQSRQVIIKAGLTPTLFDNLPEHAVLDVAFDGADEVDEDLNCIKGGGACLFQEKLVAERARKFVCVADYRKAKPRLLTTWPTIPIEVAPIAARIVLSALTALGSKAPLIRSSPLEKSGPLKTDQDFFIIDAPFPTLLTPTDVEAGKGKGDGSDGTWEVVNLSKAIKAITGVLEVGLFCGHDGIEAEQLGKRTAKGGQKPIAVYFGMEDGTVEVRRRKG
ncbi:ribose-5-phosphate isomerase [Tothia fuscella]|uniref:Ribose-5-phosphate isomerase n=1 Tax=Tothia fuscella TaxID=1048955 RepID=A0A9P4NVX9_9PEZI|nr:ribose-5-phosphate isomerase [Tothia fuscella]